ncbi:alginate O-acetyltransferase AlgX-related protein [Allokutzneria oryzae]|uniref:AlgX/AlgJ SGNH hydrolase-like domain-containing protein n=1 Tax=Allokutzneria oryzae TaxID=1378989 RepID=A0ABV5ZZ08_9PSEU
MTVQDGRAVPGKETAGFTLPQVHEAWLPREHSLHRPRHGKRQFVALVSAVAFFATPLVAWTFGARPVAFENRELVAFPSLSDGAKFFTKLPQWATDHLVFRQDAVHATDWISETFFGEPVPLDGGQNGGGPVPGNPVAPPAPSPGEPAGPEQSQPPDSSGFAKVVQGRDGWLYFGGDAQSKCQPAQPLDRTIAQMNRLRQIVERSGRRFVLVVAPDKTTAVPERLPSSYPGKDCSRQPSIDFWNRIVAEAGALDLRPQLREAATVVKHEVYHRQDTHWTDEGALVMTRRLAEAVQPGVTRTWVTEVEQQWKSNGGDLSALMGRKGEMSGAQYRLRPDGKVDRTRALGSKFVEPMVTRTAQGSGVVPQRVAVLMDSFSLAAARYLGAGFANLTLQNYLDFAKTPESAAATIAGQDVVVVEMVERALAAGGGTLISPQFLDRFEQLLPPRG